MVVGVDSAGTADAADALVDVVESLMSLLLCVDTVVKTR